MIYLSNAFSLQMLKGTDGNLKFSKIPASEVAVTEFESVVGHAETAAVLSHLLGVPVQHHRASVQLNHNDSLIVAQYIGPRLPEGATQLPEGAKFTFYLVEVTYA